MDNDDLKELIRSIKALARRADVAGRKLETAHRSHSVPAAGATARFALHQLAVVCRDFGRNAEGALDVLQKLK